MDLKFINANILAMQRKLYTFALPNLICLKQWKKFT